MKKCKNRLILLDILKVLFALFVFMRHSATMGGCSYLFLNTSFLVETNNMMMSAFFIISGFSLYYVYSDKKMNDIKNCFNFYKKRFISIFPIYILLMAIHFVFLESDFIENIKLFPLEITGLHSFFDGFFTFLHNGTTWFISCLLLSYFLYPYLQQIVNCFDKRKRKILFFLLLIFLTYLGFAFEWFNISSYTNPIFRLLEFSLGLTLCSIIDYSKKKFDNKVYMVLFIVLLICHLIIIFSEIRFLNLFLKYVLLGLIILISSKYSSKENRKHLFINFLSKMTYAFYVLQDLIWSKNKRIIDYAMTIENNYLRILFFFGVLLFLSIIITFFYQKKVSKYLSRKFDVDFK